MQGPPFLWDPAPPAKRLSSPWIADNVAAPISTLDLKIGSGDRIPIEERSGREISHIKGAQVAPDGINIANPAFDVTPHRYVAAIITERGVAHPPFQESLKRLASN